MEAGHFVYVGDTYEGVRVKDILANEAFKKCLRSLIEQLDLETKICTSNLSYTLHTVNSYLDKLVFDFVGLNILESGLPELLVRFLLKVDKFERSRRTG